MKYFDISEFDCKRGNETRIYWNFIHVDLRKTTPVVWTY